jgi:DNA-binding Lrp family transcriptional regulator
MSKRTTFTTITPLPAGITRETALAFLHNHAEMIDLNPLVIERHPINPPTHAGADEQSCVWYSITDKISYLPGTDLVRGDVTYTCAFHDLPHGIQTHCYAALGLEIRDKWSVGGSEPGETPEVQECHHVTGDYSYLLKVRVRDTAHLESLLDGTIKSLPGVVRTETVVVLSTPKETTEVPVPSADAGAAAT